MFKPTREQEDIVKAFEATRMLKVNAFAGSGKSATLQLLATANSAPSLYIAFNKAIADEASTKFPSHVECRTTHSLAFAKFGKEILHKLSRPKNGYVNVAGTPSEIAKYYKIKDIKCKGKMDDPLTANMIGSLVKDTVRRYEQSSALEIDDKHVPSYKLSDYAKNRPTLDRAKVLVKVKTLAIRLWEDRINIHSNVLATHDTYLKLYQLSSPKLNFDIIYLDEAQDTGDVVLDIVLKQEHAKIVLVGDTYQSIYEWRGAVNAMSKVTCPVKYLTKSFRFGQEIADVAYAIIQSTKKIKGYDKITSEIGTLDYDKPHTRIYRTNSALLTEAVAFLQGNANVSCEVDTNDFRKLIESAVALKQNDLKKVKHDSIIPYGSWKEMIEASDEEPELKRVAKIINTGQQDKFIAALNRMVKRDKADIIFTTAHKSKGREWSQVYLAEDFPKPNKETGKLPDQERNLLYVAATRAINVLSINDQVMNFIECSEEKEMMYE